MAESKLRDRLTAINRLDAVCHKAHALSSIVWGECGESFRNMNDEIQDATLWTLSELIEDILTAKEELYAALKRERV